MTINAGPFSPGGTVSRTVTSSTARVALGTTGHSTLMVTSPAGGNIAFIKFGDVTVEAAATDTPILPGAIYTFTISPQADLYVAAIGSATTTLYFTIGYGS